MVEFRTLNPKVVGSTPTRLFSEVFMCSPADPACPTSPINPLSPLNPNSPIYGDDEADEREVEEQVQQTTQQEDGTQNYWVITTWSVLLVITCVFLFNKWREYRR